MLTECSCISSWGSYHWTQRLARPSIGPGSLGSGHDLKAIKISTGETAHSLNPTHYYLRAQSSHTNNGQYQRYHSTVKGCQGGGRSLRYSQSQEFGTDFRKEFQIPVVPPDYRPSPRNEGAALPELWRRIFLVRQDGCKYLTSDILLHARSLTCDSRSQNIIHDVIEGPGKVVIHVCPSPHNCHVPSDHDM